MLKSAIVLTLGRSIGYALSFVRNMILARMLAKADYGLAAVLGMAITLLEISGRMAFGMQVIQSKDGDTRSFLGSAHALQFAGGAVSGLLIVGLSVPIARLFEVPQLWWAIAMMALVPVAQGMNHLDMARRQRDMDFLPLVLVDVIPQLLITMAVWPLAVWLGDYRAVVWMMIGKAIATAALTFVLAKSPYYFAWDKTHIRRMLRFGWPLLATSLLMAGYQQADQLLVGAFISLDLLANYALAFSLVSIPWFIFSQVSGSLVLPILSKAQEDPVEFRKRYVSCVESVCVIAVTTMVPLVVLGEQIATLIYGAKYAGTGLPISLLGAAFVVRFLSFTPGYAAVARGDTINQLYSNLGRSISLPLALLAAWLGGGVALIAASALIGEIVAAGISLVRLRKKQAIPFADTAPGIAYVFCFVALGLILREMGASTWGYGVSSIVLIASVALPLLASIYVFPGFSLNVAKLLAKRRQVAAPAVEVEVAK